jgi:type IV pilus assembly protein PilB
MAQMDIAERRQSQDGKIKRRFEGNSMEFRCATAPGKYGEKMVLRILNSNAEMLSLDTLISNDKVRTEFRSILNEANGIIIVSGPTGSGKSTTLASALREKDSGELNIVTAEDPIEYDLGGNIQQFPVIRAKGQTFANLLRTFLRQDPDVILIGETRDPETAESSMDAAETGHLVFTTLHANSAASSLTRLIDMEIPSYKLNASLRGVLAQRLLRKVCASCSTERPINDSESQFTGIRPGTAIRVATALTAEEKQQRKQEGTLCPRCGGSGYQGRIGTYELMKISKNIRDSIKAQKSNHEIEQIAVQEGMLTLSTYAVDLIEKQLTTISELKKISNNEY